MTSDAAVGDLVCVSWIDATFEMDRAPVPAYAQTVGWITCMDDAQLTIAAERFDDGTYRAYTCVPCISCQEVRRLGTD